MQVSAGPANACGIQSDGTLDCWGWNAYGNNYPPAGTFKQVSSGYVHACGIRTDGTMACWGENTDGKAVPISGVFTQVSAGEKHNCAIRTDGTVVCWGDGTGGKASPPGGTFTQVSAGIIHGCAVRTGGSFACWGYNAYGEAPELSISPSSLPDGNLGTAYSQTLTPGGGVAPYTFSVIEGALPDGVSLSASGIFSGPATTLGTFTFTVQVVDTSNISGSQVYTVDIIEPIKIYLPLLRR